MSKEMGKKVVVDDVLSRAQAARRRSNVVDYSVLAGGRATRPLPSGDVTATGQDVEGMEGADVFSVQNPRRDSSEEFGDDVQGQGVGSDGALLEADRADGAAQAAGGGKPDDRDHPEPRSFDSEQEALEQEKQRQQEEKDELEAKEWARVEFHKMKQHQMMLKNAVDEQRRCDLARRKREFLEQMIQDSKMDEQEITSQERRDLAPQQKDEAGAVQHVAFVDGAPPAIQEFPGNSRGAITIENFHMSLQWRELVDELRTQDTSKIDKMNNLVWTKSAARKAILTSNSEVVIATALREDPMVDSADDRPSRRQRVLESAAGWLLTHKAKNDIDHWNHAREKHPKDGVPHFLEHRTMSVPQDCTTYYRPVSGRWGARPQADMEQRTAAAALPGTPKKSVQARRAPPSPSEGASGRRCANCGSEQRRHPDLWSCMEPRVDFVRSVAELQLLRQFDAVKRSSRNLRGRTEFSDESESLGDEDSYSEDEEDDETEGDQASSSPSMSRSEASSISAKKDGRTLGSSKKSQKFEAIKEEVQSLSKDVQELVYLVQHQAQQLQSIGKGDQQRSTATDMHRQSPSITHGSEAPRREERPAPGSAGTKIFGEMAWSQSRSDSGSNSRGGQWGVSNATRQQGHPPIGSGNFVNPMHHSSSLRPAGTRTAADLPGMDGCPEIKPRDLLSIQALEVIKKKYDEYADLAVARDRDPKPFTAVFVKHSTELAMKFNNLIAMRNSLAIQLCQGEEYTGDAVLHLSNANFNALYNEICIGGVKTPSQAISILEGTTFERTVKREDGNEHDALVMRGAAAFREKLDTLPMEVLRLCTNQLIKKAFIGMMLGRQSANMADYSTCDTWMECVQHMFDISSTDQSGYFVQRARAASQGDSLRGHDEESDPDDWSKPKNKVKRGQQHDEKQWTTRADNPEEDIRLYKAEFLKMRARVKHREEDLVECHTFWKRLKKLRYLESISRDFSGGGAAAVDKNDSRGSPHHSSSGNTRQQNEGGGRAQSTPQNRAAEEARAPPSRAQVSPSTEEIQTRALVCYNCNEGGHMARDCPKPQRERRGSSPRPGAGGGAAHTARP